MLLHQHFTADGVIALVTITAGNELVRLAQAPQPVISRGFTFEPAPLEIELPATAVEQLGRGVLRLHVLSTDLTAIIRSLLLPLSVTIELVQITDPDTVIYATAPLEVEEIDYSAAMAELPLTFRDLSARRYPSDIMGPGTFPRLLDR